MLRQSWRHSCVHRRLSLRLVPDKPKPLTRKDRTASAKDIPGSHWCRLGLVSALGCLLAVQLATIMIRTTQEVRYQPLMVDEQLPFTVSGWPPYVATNPKSANMSCHLAFICDTDCGYCSALADRYVAETRSNARGVRPLWLVGGNPGRVASWADKHGLPRERVLALSTKKGWPWHPPVLGDVWVTPTRVVLTSELVVRDARPSDVLLSDEELQTLCLDGGIAPQSIAELLEFVGGDG